MATENSMLDICRLCLCSKYRKLVSNKDHELFLKIEKYLSITISSENVTEICLNCYQAVENFHSFYMKIHSVQKTLLLNFEKMILIDGMKNVSTQTGDEIDVRVEFNEKIDSVCTTESENICVTEESFLESEVLEKKIPSTRNLSTSEQVYPKAKNKKHKKEKNESAPEGEEFCKINDSNLTKTNTGRNNQKRNKLNYISKELEMKMIEFYNIKCEKCENKDLVFDSFKSLNYHYTYAHKMQGYIKCCKRNIRVNDKSYLKTHMLKHLQPDSCRCAECGKELSSIVTLKHHMLLHKPPEERPFHCNHCDKKFCCKNDLKNHEKTMHVPEHQRVDYMCDVCGKVFQKISNLRYHFTTVHLKEKKYVCDICAKSFAAQSGLRSHINAAHSTRGPLQCQECSKWLKSEDTLQKHLQLHQNNAYPCSKCDKICNSSTSLRSHMIKHSDDRPHMCTTCQKTFKTKYHLRNHSMQHTGGKNYKCPYCTKVFMNMSNFYTHRKRMHSVERHNTCINEFLPGDPKDTVNQPNLQLSAKHESHEAFSNVIYNYKLTRQDTVDSFLTSQMETDHKMNMQSKSLCYASIYS